ncbi:MAG: hypothetical protein HC772_15355 [Leptolyngbyaceae cyanobacterium CRU_2_3]|nr:hypothetical protein [Leptolyngbyaceae cyanobacterium CRU_2_3]
MKTVKVTYFFTLTGLVGIRLFYEGMRSIARTKEPDLQALAFSEAAPKAIAPADDFMAIREAGLVKPTPSFADELQPVGRVIPPKEDGLQKLVSVSSSFGSFCMDLWAVSWAGHCVHSLARRANLLSFSAALKAISMLRFGDRY